jgi:hypothetical protein
MDGEPIGFGPQYKGDDQFTARMRFHQSWYRARVLKRPWGTGPMAHSTRELGSMLLPEDGQAGYNFVTSGTFSVVRARLADRSGTVDEYRLLHNMLSSQPLCFNLFGTLALDLELATATFARLDSDVGRVKEIRIEWNPVPASDYLSDRTAFDAFVEYERVRGGLGFFGIETKLTEPFSQREYDGAAYRRWLVVSGAPWRNDAADVLHRKEHNQLWRNHLLAFALRHRSPDHTFGALAVVGHPEDVELENAIQGYRELLATESSLRIWPLDRVVDAALDAASTEPRRKWLHRFADRYLRLELSEADFTAQW